MAGGREAGRREKVEASSEQREVNSKKRAAGERGIEKYDVAAGKPARYYYSDKWPRCSSGSATRGSVTRGNGSIRQTMERGEINVLEELLKNLPDGPLQL